MRCLLLGQGVPAVAAVPRLQLGAAEEGAVTAVGGADEAELIASGVLSRYNRWGVGFSSAMQVSVCLSVCLLQTSVILTMARFLPAFPSRFDKQAKWQRPSLPFGPYPPFHPCIYLSLYL
jgi:hypothetical protein